MNLIKLLAATAVLFAATAVQAQQAYPRDLSLTLTQPTLYDDDTAIDTGDLRGALINCWRQNDAVNLIVNAEVAAPNAGGVYPLIFPNVIQQPGTYLCVAFAVTVDDVYSDMSNTVDRKYTGKPLPPVLTIVMD